MIDAVELLVNVLGLSDKDALYCCAMAKMTQPDETKGTYRKLLFVEFLEVLGRAAVAKYRDVGYMAQKSLAFRLEGVLESLLPTIGETKQMPQTYVVVSSESDEGE